MIGKIVSGANAPTVPWWLVLIEGIFSLILGLFLISAPGATSVFLVTVLGFYWLIQGIFSLVEIFLGDTGIHWGWLLFRGILGILAGLVVLRHPLLSAFVVGSVIVIIVAVEGFVMGVIDLVRAFSGGGWGVGILGVLSVIVSLILLLNVFAATLALPFVIAAFMIVGGIAAIIFSLRWRKASLQGFSKPEEGQGLANQP